MGNSVEDAALARAELTRLSPEPRAFSKLPDRNDLPINGHPGPGSRTCRECPEGVFGNFRYWRTPLPDISKDLGLLLSGSGPHEEGCGRPGTARGRRVARGEAQSVIVYRST